MAVESNQISSMHMSNGSILITPLVGTVLGAVEVAMVSCKQRRIDSF
jgi:hypothetical protein